jgi:hypothetical protein
MNPKKIDGGKMKLIILSLMFVIWCVGAGAQDYVMWADSFEDDDSLATENIGWLFLNEARGGVKDVTVKQTGGELFVQQGLYELFPGFGIGISILETNGVPRILWDNVDSTKALLLQDNYSHPNQVLSFKVRFGRWRNKAEQSSFFSINTRLNLTDPESDYPIADATVEPGYAIAMWPITGEIVCGKYDSTQLAALFPNEAWTILGKSTFPFKLEMNYWIKFYLREGDIKFKIWEGAPENEPVAWLIEATDPEPRVTGTFTAFGLAGTSPELGQGDQIFLDDVKMEGWGGSDVPLVRHSAIAENYRLEQNYPNPFNPATEIHYSLPAGQHPVVLRIFDVLGRQTTELVRQNQPMGDYRVTWNGTDVTGLPVASGVYFYLLTTGAVQLLRKMVLVE